MEESVANDQASVGSDEQLSEGGEEYEESEVEYPLIHLKEGLKDDLQEKRLRDLKLIAEKRDTNVFRFQNTEFSRELKGKNQSLKFQMKKSLNYFFSEYEYITEKMKRAQFQTMEDLKRIHLDKRKQMRMSYEFRVEEARYAVKRARDEAKFLEEQNELEEKMLARRLSIAKLAAEQRNMLMDNTVKRKRIVKMVSPEPNSDRFNKSTGTIENENDNEKENSQDSKEPVQILRIKSRSILGSSMLEATRDPNNPKVSRVYPQNRNPDENEKELQNEIKPDHFEITAVENVNVAGRDYSTPEDIEEGVSEITPIKKTAKMIMDERYRRKQKKLQAILELPFNAYRRDSFGKIEKLDHPPARKEFKEPTNKNKYKIRKVLDDEKEKYKGCINNLAEVTENIIQEDIRIKKKLNEIKKEVKPLPIITKNTNWRQEFEKYVVTSNLPEGMDPSSVEAILYCRYVRAPWEKYRHLPNYKLYHRPL